MVKFLFKGTWPPGQFQAVKTAPHHGPPVFIVEGETNLVSRCKKMTQKKSCQRLKSKKNAPDTASRAECQVQLPPDTASRAECQAVGRN